VEPPRIATMDFAPRMPTMSLRLPKTGGRTFATVHSASLSPDIPIVRTTLGPEVAPEPTIVPEIPRAILEAPVPATMSAKIRKLRRFATSSKERECLATAIYFEARGETKRGQVAVAQVVLNRASTKGFPPTICGVVYQGAKRKTGCQFSFTCDGVPDRIRERKAWATAKKIATDVLSGKTRIPELLRATHYHARYVSPYWAPKMKRLARIGRHIFYDA
jgi:spore germination cell wall hydrolase CwlJ-like protein